MFEYPAYPSLCDGIGAIGCVCVCAYLSHSDQVRVNCFANIHTFSKASTQPPLSLFSSCNPAHL